MGLEDLHTALTSVVALEEGGRFAPALETCAQALEFHPDSAALWHRKALLHLASAQFAQADAAYRRAIALDPKNPWTQFGFGLLLSSSHRPEAAAAHFERGLAIDSGAGEIRINLCAVLLQSGQIARARAASVPFDGVALPGWWAVTYRTILERLAQLRAKVRTLLRSRASADTVTLGTALHQLGRYGIAGKLMRSALQAEPGSFVAHEAYALHLAQATGADAGAAYLAGQATTFAGQVPYHLAMVRYSLAAGDLTQTMVHAGYVSEADRDGNTRRLVCFTHLLSGDTEALADTCRHWIDTTEELTPYRFALAGWRAANRLDFFGEAEADADADGPAVGLAAQVPRRIVQFWDSEAIPAEVQALMASWPANNPGYEHQVFNDATARQFLAQAYGERVLACYDHCHHPAMKADVFRLAYLLVHGGLYVDADEVCRRSVEPLYRALQRASVLLTLAAEVEPYLHNYFILARAGCPALRCAFETMLDAIETASAAGRRTDIWGTTGPGQMTRGTVKVLLAAPSLHGEAAFLTERRYRVFATTENDLAYKRTSAGDWRRA